VRLTVRDFGAGIPAEESERVFTPFFTTKSEGMGMGLSICRTIVQAHNGRLWFERQEPGTAFHLWVAAEA
jgi:signal transduction histidine kinase